MKTFTTMRGALMAAVLSVIAVGAASGSAVPAYAHYEQCPQGAFCVWTDYGGNGRFAYFYTGGKNLTEPVGGYVFNDRIVSVWNRADKTFCLFDHVGYSGPGVSVATDGKGNLPGAWQKRASSLREHYAGTAC